MIEVVSATRLSEAEFWESSALGISLRRLRFDGRMTPRIEFENSRGLPVVYNSQIAEADPERIMVFIHDDVWLDDVFFADRVIVGLEHYDVIGVAGNRRRIAFQPAWAFVDDSLRWDDGVNLSGVVAHGRNPFGEVSVYGDVPADCELLDGVLLAARKSVLVESGVLFDEQFDFHFYDMDFSRSARQAGLRLGTWGVGVTHQSGGGFGSERWRKNYRAYLAKWESVF